MDKRFLNVEMHSRRSRRKSRRYSRRSNHRRSIILLSVLLVLLVVGAGFYVMKMMNQKSGKKDQTENHEEVMRNTQEDTTQQDSSTEAEEETTDTVNLSEGENQNEQEMILGNIPSENNIEIDPDKPMVAITFDDGPAGNNTAKILDALKENGGHATFFVVGYNLSDNEDVMKRAVAEGSEIGSHTMSHSVLTSLDDAALDEEIGGMKQKIRDITGQETVVIRPPYGAVDDRVLSHIEDPVILWSLDTNDWETRNVEMTIQSVQQNVFDGAIILMHDIHAETVDAALQIIPWLKEQGYQMVTISELGYYRRGGLRMGVRYGSIEP